jgi:WD repeat-containing protein 23
MMSRSGKDTSGCDGESASHGSSATGGPSKPSNYLDHEIAQLTELSSRPQGLLSQGGPGRLRLPVSTVKMLVGRESNHSGRGRFSSADGCHILSRYLPVNGAVRVDRRRSRAYVSQFSADGSLFVAAFQVFYMICQARNELVILKESTLACVNFELFCT